MLIKSRFFYLLNTILLLSLFIVLVPTKTIAQETLTEFWQRELQNRDLEVKNTSFCFIDRQGNLKGLNVEKILPIASLSKIITSLASLRHYGKAYHQFKTTISYSAEMNAIHIESNGDPTLSDEKIWLMISKINEWQIKKIKKLTFNERFYFMPYLYRNPQFEYRRIEGNITKVGPYIPFPAQTQVYLHYYLNTENYSTLIKKQLLEMSEENSQINKNLSFNVEEISLIKTNPLSHAADLQQFSFNSLPLIHILKYMNSVSNNPITDIMHYDIGGTIEVNDSLRGILPAEDLKLMAWYSGSGLPLTSTTSSSSLRQVNLLSCRGMLFVKQHFKNLVDALTLDEAFNLPRPFDPFSSGLLKSLPVSGQEGTIRNYSEFTNIFVGKTGTLRDAKLLTTFISTHTGTRLFTMMGVAATERLNRLTDVYKIMLTKAIEAFSGAMVFNYTPPKIADNKSANKTKLKPLSDLRQVTNFYRSSYNKILFLMNNSDCVEENCQELVRSILKADQSWNKLAKGHDSLLQQSIIANNLFVTRELLLAGADANQKVFHNKIPLFFLAVHQNLEMVKLLMKNPKTNLELKNGSNLSVYEYAAQYAYSPSIKNYLTSPN